MSNPVTPERVAPDRPEARPRSLLHRARSSQTAGIYMRGASSVFVTRVGGIALVFGLELLLARVLGGAEYGNYVYVFTWVKVLAVVARFGLDTSLVRYVSSHVATGEGPSPAAASRSALALAVAVGLGVMGVGFVVVTAWPGESTALRETWLWGLALVPLFGVTYVAQGVLRGLHRVGLAEVPFMIVRPLAVAAVIGVAYLAGYRLDGTTAMVWTVAVMVGVAAYGMGQLRWAVRTGVKPSPVVERGASAWGYRTWIGVSLPFLLISLTQTVQGQTALLAVGWIEGTTEAGIYNVAARVMLLLNFGLVASNMILASMIAKVWAEGDMARLQKMVAMASVVVTAYTIVVGTALLLGGPWVLSLFGDEFAGGYATLVILVAGMAVNTLAGPVGYLMSMTKHPWVTTKAMAFGAVLNIVLSILLIPRFGIEGAAAAEAISTVAWNLVLIRASFRLLHIDPTVFSVIRYLRRPSAA